MTGCDWANLLWIQGGYILFIYYYILNSKIINIVIKFEISLKLSETFPKAALNIISNRNPSTFWHNKKSRKMYGNK